MGQHFQNRYIYLVKASNGLYKIGATKNLRSRVPLIRAHSPLKVELTQAFFGRVGINDVETKVHDFYASRRSHGEWFRLGADGVRNFERILRSIGTFLKVFDCNVPELSQIIPGPLFCEGLGDGRTSGEQLLRLMEAWSAKNREPESATA